jgi:anti-sigma factor RsiW
MGVCEYSDQLSAYVDGELSAGRRAALEGHLLACADCDAEVSELRGMSRMLAAAVGPFLRAQAIERFHQNISELQDEQEQAERTVSRVLRITRVLTGIAACLLVTGSVWLMRSRQQPPLESPARFVDATPSSALLPPAPWDVAIQPIEATSVAATDKAPADATADWMIGGLVSSSSLAQSSPVGEDDQQ